MEILGIDLIGPFMVTDNGRRCVCTPTKSAGDFANVLLKLIDTVKREGEKITKQQTN